MYFTYCVRKLGSDGEEINIAAKSMREAAKFYGLVLKHQGTLKPLGHPPCEVNVVTKQPNNHKEKRFKLWNAENKIYAQCFMTKKNVSKHPIKSVIKI